MSKHERRWVALPLPADTPTVREERRPSALVTAVRELEDIRAQVGLSSHDMQKLKELKQKKVLILAGLAGRFLAEGQFSGGSLGYGLETSDPSVLKINLSINGGGHKIPYYVGIGDIDPNTEELAPLRTLHGLATRSVQGRLDQPMSSSQPAPLLRRAQSPDSPLR